MRFLRSPVEILAGDLRKVEAMRLETMQLQEQGGRQVALPTGTTEDIPVRP